MSQSVLLATRIGRNICQARKARGLSQAKLGLGVGVDAGTVSRWERGAMMPRIENVAEIARLCDRDLAWFFAER